MTRRNSGPANKGSRFHLQKMVNLNQDYLNHLMLSNSPSLKEYSATQPIWVSPLSADNYREYSDNDFLNIIDQIGLRKKLREFWPTGGPYWDALARVERKNGERGVILAEAKANIPELGGPNYACGAENISSRNKIENSLVIVKQALGVKPDTDWMGDYYQYANRLAHLYFLYVICKVPTWLVYICFIGAKKAIVPSTEEDWAVPLANVQKALRLPESHRLSSRIVYIFPKVANQ